MHKKISLLLLVISCSLILTFALTDCDVFSTSSTDSAEADIHVSINDQAIQRTYLPIRVVLEAFETIVGRNSDSQTIEPIKVHFIDVGQGDSIFIDSGTYEILIDGGSNKDGKEVAHYIKPYIDGNLELMVASHTHIDHIGGLDDILYAYQVDQIVHSDETSTTKSFQDFYQAATSEPDCVYSGDEDRSFGMGNGAAFSVLEMGDGYGDSNENSIVSMLTYNHINILFMADLETTVERINLQKFKDIDVLKVGHHGSRTATSKEFLDIIKPEVSIISAGKDNEFLQPNAIVLSRLAAMNSMIYGTFRSGDIVLTTDGFTYDFDTDIPLTVKDAKAPANLPFAGPGSGLSGMLPVEDKISENEAAFIGNIKTLKYHTVFCSAGSKISDRNVICFKSREDAVNQGYQPCKLCNVLGYDQPSGTED